MRIPRAFGQACWGYGALHDGNGRVGRGVTLGDVARLAGIALMTVSR
ncbi:LacI family DNA-binding transcriptional regulator [Pseudomonas coronafaciens]|nr:LacI family DNA-binding transcriptional regulator [Pseudomonas coronafaciens]